MPLYADRWIALVIGNTRLHWGFFDCGYLKGVWHTPHLTGEMAHRLISHRLMAKSWQDIAELTFDSAQSQLPEQPIAPSSIWMASVVSKQSKLWVLQSQAAVHIVLRSRIPLSGLYPTLGIDRAINLLGAGSAADWPVLVIDAGTALTLTAGVQTSGVDKAARGSVYGGAILPGLRLQRRALASETSALSGASDVDKIFSDGLRQQMLMPRRWANDTSGAIASGISHSMVATITDYLVDWWRRFPTGHVILTGGDGPLLHTWLQKRTPEIASRVQVDSCLMFRGMQVYRSALILAS